MKTRGGFEGNAQTLRILSKLEKKMWSSTSWESKYEGFDEDGKDCRAGLNLTFRCLASILKYDNEVSSERPAVFEVQKGYYREERELVREVKASVTYGRPFQEFKTVECWIMDVADDIAYSTYDIEDAFKAEFLNPLDLLSADRELVERVSERVSKSLKTKFTDSQTRKTLLEILPVISEGDRVEEMVIVPVAYKVALELASNGYYRSNFTSDLLGRFIQSVKFIPNESVPALSKVELEPSAREQVEVLKHFSYESIISSPDLRVVSFRGRKIVTELFDILLRDEEGHGLLPQDYRSLFNKAKDDQIRSRIVCDFISSMTDKYAIEYFGRLTSESPQSLFKKLA